VVGEVVERMSCAGSLFIGGLRRWGGGAPVVAGELVGATLMAAGPAVALCCAGVEASRGAVARSGEDGSWGGARHKGG